MKIPEFLKQYETEAREYLKEKRVTDVEYSGATYQVQVKDADSGEKVWAFLQLNPNNTIKDCFCSCREEEDNNSCVHLATAYLYIFKGQPIPLHRRFQHSLWNALCTLYGNRLSFDTHVLKKAGPGHFQHTSHTGKKVFFLKGKTQSALKHVDQIVLHRTVETEETSLKFSNLSPEELALWHEGKPSIQLSYELSFWSDLAKWLMALQEKGAAYKITFEYGPNQLPNWITIDFNEIQVGFYLSEANLPLIIPPLHTVDSPLKVYDEWGEKIERIEYVKEKGEIIIHLKEHAKKSVVRKHHKDVKGYELKGWTYYPKEGFYSKGEHSLLQKTVLKGDQISHALNEYVGIIQEYLEGTQIAPDPASPSYQIYFDSQWDLHIVSYLFERGDLTLPYSRCFGDWVYIEDEGFYRLEGKRFDEVETVVPKARVPEFISQNRTWLNKQPGFHTHLINVESHLTYHVDAEGRLNFDSQIDLEESGQKPIDFQNWIYIPGQGFYQKLASQQNLPVRSGTSISVDQLSLFIKMHRDELNSVPGFFSKESPIAKMGLNVELNDQGVIAVTPDYQRHPDYKERELRFYDEYVYIPGEGFHQLPIDPKIPERFRHPVEITPENQDLFLSYELDQIRPFIDEIDPRLQHPKEVHLILEGMEKAERSGQGWYVMKMIYRTNIGKVDVQALWEAQHAKKRFVFTPAGLFDLEAPNFNWIKYLGRHRIDKRRHAFLLSTLDILRMHAFETIELPSPRKHGYANIKAMLQEITEFKVPEEPDLTGFKSHLRPYQEKGLQWLWFLYHQSLSGLLCDDMGLGKTHQAMGLIAAALNYNQKMDRPKKHILIVCPTSVIYHWQDKLHTFLPHLKVCTFYGTKRSFEDFHKRYDILLTSYGIWRLENKVLNEEPYELAIFDEIQVAKNQSSLLHNTLLDVKARMRLGMSGTPIENRLRELKSLFDIVLPTYMPSDTEFRSFFVKPIEKEHDIARRQLLSRFIHPFILRRKKQEVLNDLPDKTESISYCALLPDQLSLYQQVLETSRKSILEQLKDESSSIPYLHVFALLTKLKQICNHPAVYWQNPAEFKKYQSGKWQLFVELLHEARDSGQKVVVFSQYLMQLDIIEMYLKEHKIGYAAIRGATTRRGEEIKRFHDEPECEVFVGSLQAAGLGIDLTAASVVIHYDRWWNAARENQATDRVHRIGQQRGVQVMKLVTRSTFEERINEMITAKGQLMEDVVGTDDQAVLKMLTRNDIVQLLQDVHLTAEDVTEVLPDVEEGE